MLEERKLQSTSPAYSRYHDQLNNRARLEYVNTQYMKRIFKSFKQGILYNILSDVLFLRFIDYTRTIFQTSICIRIDNCGSLANILKNKL